MVSPGLTYEIQRPVRWNTFVAGLSVNLILLALVAEVAPRIGQEVTVRNIDPTHYVALVVPVIYAPAPRPVEPPPQIARLEPPKLSPVVAPKPAPVAPSRPLKTEIAKIAPPKPAPTQPESRHIETNVFEATASTNPPAPHPEIKTNVFASAPAQTATLQKPARQIQTGGFGDPNGAAGQGDPKRDTVAMVHVGSFGAPSGPGKRQWHIRRHWPQRHHPPLRISHRSRFVRTGSQRDRDLQRIRYASRAIRRLHSRAHRKEARVAAGRDRLQTAPGLHGGSPPQARRRRSFARCNVHRLRFPADQSGGQRSGIRS